MRRVSLLLVFAGSTLMLGSATWLLLAVMGR
jgi:hypothetical protein